MGKNEHTNEKYFTQALKNGQLVHISEVENGLDCDCICPCCETPVVAHNNPKNKKAIHFQHHNKSSCDSYYETIIHYMAKEVISEQLELIVPAHEFLLSDYARSYCDYDWIKDNPTKSIKPVTIKFESIEVEKYRNGIKPDLIGKSKGRELHIEIAVTHFIDDEKLEKIKNLGFTSLEIDLSKFDREMQMSELKSLIKGRIDLMKWYNNQSILKNKLKAEVAKRTITDFIYNNTISKTVYGRIKKVYNCPIVATEYKDEVSLNNCHSCRYLAFENEELEVVNWNDREFKNNMTIDCIGHSSKDFDKLLELNGVKVGRNKAFGK